MVNKKIDTPGPDEEQQKLIDFIENITDLWKNKETEKYDINKIHEIITRVTEIFKSEPMLVPFPPPCIIIGDYGTRSYSLKRILIGQLGRTFKDKTYWNRFVFLGNTGYSSSDYIDCICILFTLKIMYPKQYVLIRGRFETKDSSMMQDFKIIEEKEAVKLWDHFNEAFSWMPLASITGGKVLCVHSGISPELNSLDDIRGIKRPLLDVRKNRLAYDLLFKLPTKDKELKFDKNGFDDGLNFNSQAIQKCCHKMRIRLIIRTHEIVEGKSCIDFYPDRYALSICSFPTMPVGWFYMGSALNLAIDGTISFRWLTKGRTKREIEKLGKPSDYKLMMDIEKDFGV